MDNQSPFEQFDELRIDASSKLFLAEAGKWTTFLAILGYIGIGFMILAGIMMISLGNSAGMYGKFFPMGSGLILGSTYLVLAGLYFIPINYLYRFGSNMKTAISSNNQASLTRAFEYLKSHYKFIGILTIILIGLYILIIIAAIILPVGAIR
ncbi:MULTISPECIES: DUF5362 family protein [Chryseobacterium]|uniref:DUF5362 domain-containing protein n=1 Tax=Chryseobacterium camelliae TaxID=1265445 RepID=A0ABU0TEN8_9FLAO|nr:MULTISPECIES: DUF5362 family protein [Chryseobacterium]MDT3406668.1 hypothetical protein [Pseudacidovorax intermedius]MDQ1095534.1 hypothetical protein [Chryseobacterium camelliae]MDQ1099472.1 hypothetical protein [Chryseobacterium sp. SORGH_AS_1048]MDR6086817.1 hypothetical protein [Chryseobacterium sp. SORGH_AS_0909]MDR6131190.1 hypothetical protein [Chryseobacterium sp. SORGH_AS_1175]